MWSTEKIRRGDWQVERDLQLLLGRLLLPRLRGGELGGSCKDGRSNILSLPLDNSIELHYRWEMDSPLALLPTQHSTLNPPSLTASLRKVCIYIKWMNWTKQFSSQANGCLILPVVPGSWALPRWRGEGSFDNKPSRRLLTSLLRSAVALHAEVDPLEDLGNYLRTISLEVDSTYREKDGIVSKLLA